MAVLDKSLSQYKPSLYETCRTLIHSGTKKADEVKQLSAEIERLQRLNQQLAVDLRQARDDANQSRKLQKQTMLENQQVE